MLHTIICMFPLKRHNPYFNRWFSAILVWLNNDYYIIVTILILIDGFLQFNGDIVYDRKHKVTILILIDGFLQ